MAKKVSTSGKTAKSVKNAENSQKKEQKPTARKKKCGTSAATFKARIVKALKAQDRYQRELDMLIGMTADSLHIWSRAKDEIASLGSTWTKEESKYGFKLVEHPSCKTHRAYSAECRNLLKALGLTFEDLINKERDELSDFDEELNR